MKKEHYEFITNKYSHVKSSPWHPQVADFDIRNFSIVRVGVVFKAICMPGLLMFHSIATNKLAKQILKDILDTEILFI